MGALDEVTPEAWDATLAVNLRGTFLVCPRCCRGCWREGGGAWSISPPSPGGRRPPWLPQLRGFQGGGDRAHHVPRGAGRGARGAGQRRGPRAGGHGEIRTPGPEMQARLLQTLPMGRLASAREVAQAIVFLASPCASYITGETLNVNGGAFMV